MQVNYLYLLCVNCLFRCRIPICNQGLKTAYNTDRTKAHAD